jgi:aspartyl protease family protein
MSNAPKLQHALRYIGVLASIAFCATAMQPAAAEQPIFKCGSTYTNVPPGQGPAQARTGACVLVDPAKRPGGSADNLTIDGSRHITIPVGQDGRFWIRGSVNGFPVQFVIDKGSTVRAGIAVTEDFAAQANLIGGASTHVQTTAGVMEARRLERVPVTIGPFRMLQAPVFVGSLGGKSDAALLGQEVLSLFDVTANDREMTISSK